MKRIPVYTIVLGVAWLICVFTLFVLPIKTAEPKQSKVEVQTPDCSYIRAIIGEAADQGYHGMLAMAVAIRNRGTLNGVYGLTNPMVDNEPEWVWEMAKKAWNESSYNRIHIGTHWENISKFGSPSWEVSMKVVYAYKDHVFYIE